MNRFYYFNEFIAHVNADVVGRDLFASNTGTGAGITSGQVSSKSNVVGVALMTTGTTSTGRACLINSTLAACFGGGPWVLQVRIDSMSAVSAAAERYSFGVGFIDNNASNVMTDGALFLYDEGGVTTGSAASANWQCVTAEAGTREYTTSSIAVATTGQTLRIEVDAAGTEVVFYVDGVEAGRHSTYIPETRLTEVFGFGSVLLKSVGSTARTVGLDYFMVENRYSISK